jgi:hypothetical protein
MQGSDVYDAARVCTTPTILRTHGYYQRFDDGRRHEAALSTPQCGGGNIYNSGGPRNQVEQARVYGSIRDLDRDGIMNQQDHDRDGDGVHNRNDRHGGQSIVGKQARKWCAVSGREVQGRAPGSRNSEGPQE